MILPKHTIAVALILSVISATILVAPAQEKPLPTQPEALYIFPAAGHQGSTVEVRIDGQTLAGAYAVWTDCEDLQARVKQVVEVDGGSEEGSDPAEKRLTQQVTLEIKIGRSAGLGGHTLRLVSPRGVSNPMPFRVSPAVEAVILEDEDQTGSDKPIEGQPIEFPLAISGRISRTLGGEVDYYSFDVEQGQELDFEVFFPPLGGKMLLYLYQPAASWVDPHRLVQLAFNDDPILFERGLFGTPPDLILRARLRHRFTHPGRYLIAVKAFDDRGGPAFVYQLRVASPPDRDLEVVHRAWPSAHPRTEAWEEHRFHRPLTDDRLQQLGRRTVRAPAAEASSPGVAGSGTTAESASEASPRRVALTLDLEKRVVPHRALEDSQAKAEPIRIAELPALIEGVIDPPGKTDHFRFRVQAGEALAFEVETPRQIVPRFNPWLRVMDENQDVIFSCVYNRVEGNNVQLFRYFEPKMVYTFQQGEYTVEIRDLTRRHGGPEFVYRLMIRRQVPHIGKLQLDVDRINLVQGEGKPLIVTADREEGFEGEIALSVDNLPEGLEALPTAVLEPPRPPAFDEGQKEIFRPETQKVAISLIADSKAPATQRPQVVGVSARPIVNGRPGRPIPVGEVLVMVLPPASNVAAEAARRE